MVCIITIYGLTNNIISGKKGIWDMSFTSRIPVAILNDRRAFFKTGRWEAVACFLMNAIKECI